MNSIIRIKVSEGEDREAIRIKIQQLIDFSGWQLRDENTISKTYHVTTYTKAVVSGGPRGNTVTDLFFAYYFRTCSRL